MTTLNKVGAAVARISLVLSGCALIGIFGVVLANVLLRAFALPSIGADEWSAMLLVAMTFIGLAEVTWRHQHIRVEMVISLIKPKARFRLELLAYYLVSIAFVGAMLWLATGFAWAAWDDELRSDGMVQMPLVIPRTVMALGVLAMLVVLGVQFVDALRTGRISASRGEQP